MHSLILADILCAYQWIPSLEVAIAPSDPAATKRSFPYVTASRFFLVPDLRSSHFLPSAEETTVPPSPTATKTPFPYTMPFRLLVVFESC